MLKAAIIGPGQVSEKVHAAYYKTRHDILEIVGVSGTHMGRALAFAERNGVKHAYTDVAEMLRNEKPDIVSICTPNRFHYENVMKCLEAGAAVICEKPPAMTSEQAKEMADYADEQGLTLAYNFHHRFSHPARMIKEHGRMLGDIYYAEVKALRRSGVPGWGSFIDKEIQGGGPLIDYGIHMLDLALYLTNFPKPVKLLAHKFEKLGRRKTSGSFGSWDPEAYTVEDALIGTIEFDTGLIMRLSTSFILNMREEKVMDVIFYGDEAGASLSSGEIYSDQAGKLVVHHKVDPATVDLNFQAVHNFLDHYLGNEEAVIADGQQGFLVQYLIDQLYYSAETGKEVIL